MEVYLGLFSKKINSTAQLPDTEGFIKMDCQVKEPSSILNPRLIISVDNWNPTLNYAYIPLWSRYYFIHNATVEPGKLVELDLAVDVLGTYRTSILDATAFVRRSASDYNLKLPDDTWSHSSDYTITSDVINMGLASPGVFLLFTTSGKPSHGIPAQSVYVIDSNTLNQVITYLLSDTFYSAYTSDMDSTTGALSKTFFNPFQYVNKCMYMELGTPNAQDPAGHAYFAGESDTIHFGWWDSGITAKRLESNYHIYEKSFTLGSYTKWTDRSDEWTQNVLYVPGIGSFNIPAEYEGQTINLRYIIDYTSGECNLIVSVDSGDNNPHKDHMIQLHSGKFGCDIQLSGLYEDLVGDTTTMSGLVGKGLKALAGGLMGAVNSGLELFKSNSLSDILTNASPIASAVVQGASAGMQPTASHVGSDGCRAQISYENEGRLTIRKYNEYDSVRERLGYMCMKTRQLNGLSGYTEVVNPSVQTIGTSGEDSMINAFMSGGFYIE